MKRSFSFFLVLTLVVLSSCDKATSNHGDLQKLDHDDLQNLVEQNIKIPNSMYAYSVEEDTIEFFNYDDTNSQNKIITYIDGDCFSCVEELNKWVEIEDEIILKESIEFLFIIKTDWDYFQIIKDYIFKSNFFDTKTGKLSTIILDMEGDFVKSNIVPDDRILQAMLLGDKKRIVVFGNPVYSDEIKQLYIDSIKVK